MRATQYALGRRAIACGRPVRRGAAHWRRRRQVYRRRQRRLARVQRDDADARRRPACRPRERRPRVLLFVVVQHGLKRSRRSSPAPVPTQRGHQDNRPRTRRALASRAALVRARAQPAWPAGGQRQRRRHARRAAHRRPRQQEVRRRAREADQQERPRGARRRAARLRAAVHRRGVLPQVLHGARGGCACGILEYGKKALDRAIPFSPTLTMSGTVAKMLGIESPAAVRRARPR